MRLTWEQTGGWFDREYLLVDHDENTVEKIGRDPSLITLRNAERKYGERIDLWQTGLLCSECGNEINDRFGSTPDGSLLCWKCAKDAQRNEENQLYVNTDPTKATISESHLHEKSLCDYVINVATGCRHGCKFCYVPATPGLKSRDSMLNEQVGVKNSQQEWGNYLLYRDDLPERLRTELESKDDWKHTKGGRGVVMLSSGTDCYQDRRAAQITRGCVAELVKHSRPVRILTRSPAVVRDIDLFKEHKELITVGSSIPSLDDELVQAMEPNAPPPSARWEALDKLRKERIRRFVSMSPTYPTMGEDEIWNVLTFLKALDPEVIFHEPINPRGANFQMCQQAARENGRSALANELEKLTNHQNWVEYAVKQINLVQQLADEIGGLQIHSWPDRELIQSTTGELRFKLNDMKSSVSPEQFTGEPIEESGSQGILIEDPEKIRSQIRS